MRDLRHNNTSCAYVGDNSDCKVNLAGNVSLSSDACDHRWIIDLGATNYITSSQQILAEFSSLSDQRSNTVQLPTGNGAHIVKTGHYVIMGCYKVKNVLHVLDFKFNLFSVARLTKNVLYSITFVPNFCVMQLSQMAWIILMLNNSVKVVVNNTIRDNKTTTSL